ncbi:hypothetical protein Tco_1266177 [Tanacetum coccineum]
MDASGGSGSNSHVWPIVDDNSAVDMNGTMDNLEERIANLEMVNCSVIAPRIGPLVNASLVTLVRNTLLAFLFSKTLSYDDTADEDITEFEVASKSKSSTSKPKEATAHKVVTQKVQTKVFPAKIPVPIRNYTLGLVAAHTWACIGNKTFGTRKPKDAIVGGQDRKGKKKV